MNQSAATLLNGCRIFYEGHTRSASISSTQKKMAKYLAFFPLARTPGFAMMALTSANVSNVVAKQKAKEGDI